MPSQNNMAVQSVDPAGLSRHVESCPLLMCVCPVRSHRCQTQSLVLFPSHSHSLFPPLSSFCLPSVHLPLICPLSLSPLPLSGPCSLLPPCMKSPFTPRVYTKILPLNTTHILCPPPQKKTKNRWHFFPVFLVSSSSLSSPPPSLFSPCFFPSSRCSTDPNWQSTCLFSLFTHSLI